jgi:hypothetical protein
VLPITWEQNMEFLAIALVTALVAAILLLIAPVWE